MYTDLLIDPEDKWLVESFFWGISSHGYLRRAVMENGRQRIIYLHREVMGLKPGDPLVDHINGNKFDNRKCNLRLADKAINRINTDKVRSDSGTGIKGVTKDRRTGRYCVYMRRNGHKIHYGSFKDLNSAKALAERVYREARV
jgi:hypothetical protein